MGNFTRITAGGSILLSLSVPSAQAEIPELATVLESADWNTLKTIWRLADRAVPTEDWTNLPIAPEKGDSMIALVNGLFSETGLENGPLKTSLNLIQRITSARIMRLSRLSSLMLTRMLPPWTATVQDNMLFNFEVRITALTGLVAAGEISSAEFIAARDTLFQKAETWAVLEILAQSQPEMYFYGYAGNNAEEMSTEEVLERLDLSYSAALDTLSRSSDSAYREYYLDAVEQHKEFMRSYEEFQTAKPVLRVLLMDLMEPGI
jgi:hypothetical protein